MRVWLVVTAALATMTAAESHIEGPRGRHTIRTTGHAATGRHSIRTIGHTAIPQHRTLGHDHASSTGQGGQVIKGELIGSIINPGQRGLISTAGQQGRVISVGQSMRVAPAHGGKIISSRRPVRGRLVAETMRSPKTTLGQGSHGKRVQKAIGITASPSTSAHGDFVDDTVRDKRRGDIETRNGKKDTSALYETAKLAATLDRAIPIDLSKYSRLDREALLSLSSHGNIGREDVLRLLGNGKTSDTKDTSEDTIKNEENDNKGPEDLRQEAETVVEDAINIDKDEENEDVKGGIKREVFDIVNSKEQRFRNVFPLGNSREHALHSLFLKGDSREITGGYGLGSLGLGNVHNRGYSNERSRGGVYGTGVSGRRIPIELSGRRGDSGEHGHRQGSHNIFGGHSSGHSQGLPLFGYGGRGFDLFSLLGKDDSREKHGSRLSSYGNLHQGGGLGKGILNLDPLGLFNKGSIEKLDLFGTTGYGSKEGLGSLLAHKDYSNERSDGYYGNKPGGLALLTKGLNLLGLLKKGITKGTVALLKHKANKSSKDYSHSRETYGLPYLPSKEKPGIALTNKGAVGHLVRNAFDVLGVLNKGSKEKPGLYAAKHSIERSSGNYRDDSHEKVGSFLAHGASGALDIFEGIKDLTEKIWGR